jgi:putative tricarboxylic transport membrane protein
MDDPGKKERGSVVNKSKPFPLELSFDLILTVLGIIITFASLKYGFGTFRAPGPGLFPFFIGLSLFIFGLALAISEFRTPMRSASLSREDFRTFLFMILAFCIWILVMPLLGYVIVTVLVAFGICKIMKLEGWWKPLSVSVGTALFIYFLFDYCLYIDLPKGILG